MVYRNNYTSTICGNDFLRASNGRAAMDAVKTVVMMARIRHSIMMTDGKNLNKYMQRDLLQ